MSRTRASIRAKARAITRVIALVTMTMALCARVLVEQATARILGRSAPETERHVRSWARMTARIIGMRVHVEGELPGGPVALVSNHLSYIDIVALWCLIPGVFVARADVAGWPLIGAAGRLIGTIFIDRTRKRDLLRVIPEMQHALATGHNVIFFPEGTSSRGTKVLPFKSPLFDASVRENVPIVAASLQFETRPPAASADWSVCWWGDMSFSPHAFDLLHMSGFEARVRFSSPIGIDRYGDRKFAPIENPVRSVRSVVEGTDNAMSLSDVDTNASPPQRSGILRSKERKALCRLSYEAALKNFLPTTPVEAHPPVESAMTARPAALETRPAESRRAN